MSRGGRGTFSRMTNGDLHWIANYVWGIADEVLRDVYVRGKYRDIILPMIVLRRLDAVLEDCHQDVLDMNAYLDELGVDDKDATLREAAGHAFYNTSKFTLRDLRARANRQQLKADFEAYLDGFSPNVQDILDNFEFRSHISKLSDVVMLTFGRSGEVELVPERKGDAVAEAKLEASRLYLHLNWPRFREDRVMIYHEIERDIHRGEDLAPRDFNGMHPVAQAFLDICKDLAKRTEPHQEYSRAARAYVEMFRDRWWIRDIVLRLA